MFFGRFTALLCTYAAFLAGASRMSWRRFLPANAAGGIVWAGVCTIASYLAGDTLRRLSATISLVLTVVGVLAIVAVGSITTRGHIDHGQRPLFLRGVRHSGAFCPFQRTFRRKSGREGTVWLERIRARKATVLQPFATTPQGG